MKDNGGVLFEENEVKPEKIKLGNTRVTGKEQYYTPANQAAEILTKVLIDTKKDRNSSFLEPAGGTGSFIKAAQGLGFHKITSLDIEPKHPDVEKGDFLSSNLDIRNAICVTNPPFGRNNSLSIPFFNKAAAYSDVIAFIVPRSWRKWSVINRLDKRFKLISDWDLEVDYVDDQEIKSHGSGNLRTCVQVWLRQETLVRNTVRVPDYQLISRTSPQLADVSLTLFGYGCGTVKTDFPRIKNTTQAFLKLNHPDALDALMNVDFSLFYNHTAYTEALGFQEINFLINNYLGLEKKSYSTNPLDKDYLGLSYSLQDELF